MWGQRKSPHLKNGSLKHYVAAIRRHHDVAHAHQVRQMFFIVDQVSPGKGRDVLE